MHRGAFVQITDDRTVPNHDLSNPDDADESTALGTVTPPATPPTPPRRKLPEPLTIAPYSQLHPTTTANTPETAPTIVPQTRDQGAYRVISTAPATATGADEPSANADAISPSAPPTMPPLDITDLQSDPGESPRSDSPALSSPTTHQTAPDTLSAPAAQVPPQSVIGAPYRKVFTAPPTDAVPPPPPPAAPPTTPGPAAPSAPSSQPGPEDPAMRYVVTPEHLRNYGSPSDATPTASDAQPPAPTSAQPVTAQAPSTQTQPVPTEVVAPPAPPLTAPPLTAPPLTTPPPTFVAPTQPTEPVSDQSADTVAPEIILATTVSRSQRKRAQRHAAAEQRRQQRQAAKDQRRRGPAASETDNTADTSSVAPIETAVPSDVASAPEQVAAPAWVSAPPPPASPAPAEPGQQTKQQGDAAPASPPASATEAGSQVAIETDTMATGWTTPPQSDSDAQLGQPIPVTVSEPPNDELTATLPHAAPDGSAVVPEATAEVTDNVPTDDVPPHTEPQHSATAVAQTALLGTAATVSTELSDDGQPPQDPTQPTLALSKRERRRAEKIAAAQERRDTRIAASQARRDARKSKGKPAPETATTEAAAEPTGSEVTMPPADESTIAPLPEPVQKPTVILPEASEHTADAVELGGLAGPIGAVALGDLAAGTEQTPDQITAPLAPPQPTQDILAALGQPPQSDADSAAPKESRRDIRRAERERAQADKAAARAQRDAHKKTRGSKRNSTTEADTAMDTSTDAAGTVPFLATEQIAVSQPFTNTPAPQPPSSPSVTAEPDQPDEEPIATPANQGLDRPTTPPPPTFDTTSTEHPSPVLPVPTVATADSDEVGNTEVFTGPLGAVPVVIPEMSRAQRKRAQRAQEAADRRASRANRRNERTSSKVLAEAQGRVDAQTRTDTEAQADIADIPADPLTGLPLLPPPPPPIFPAPQDSTYRFPAPTTDQVAPPPPAPAPPPTPPPTLATEPVTDSSEPTGPVDYLTDTPVVVTAAAAAAISTPRQDRARARRQATAERRASRAQATAEANASPAKQQREADRARRAQEKLAAAEARVENRKNAKLAALDKREQAAAAKDAQRAQREAEKEARRSQRKEGTLSRSQERAQRRATKKEQRDARLASKRETRALAREEKQVLRDRKREATQEVRQRKAMTNESRRRQSVERAQRREQAAMIRRAKRMGIVPEVHEIEEAPTPDQPEYNWSIESGYMASQSELERAIAEIDHEALDLPEQIPLPRGHS